MHKEKIVIIPTSIRSSEHLWNWTMNILSYVLIEILLSKMSKSVVQTLLVIFVKRNLKLSVYSLLLSVVKEHVFMQKIECTCVKNHLISMLEILLFGELSLTKAVYCILSSIFLMLITIFIDVFFVWIGMPCQKEIWYTVLRDAYQCRIQN